MVKSSELIKWGSQDIHDNYIIFDKIMDMYDDIEYFMKSNNLDLNCDKQVFLMHLFLFVYKNSKTKITRY